MFTYLPEFKTQVTSYKYPDFWLLNFFIFIFLSVERSDNAEFMLLTVVGWWSGVLATSFG